MRRNLKPQDVVVVLKLALHPDVKWSFSSLAHALGMSASEVHAAVKRAKGVGLLHATEWQRPNRSALKEFPVHGLKYVFPPERGGRTRGMPTGYAAPPLVGRIAADEEPVPVWPDAEGTMRGEAFSPLYRSAVAAARLDPELYECLALVDAIRGGQARERNLAKQYLEERLAS